VIETAHTADLPRATLDAAHRLLEDIFAGELGDDDWEHALGGVHALCWEDGELVGHGSVVMRRLLHGGRTLRTGYVECVGVRADRRRRGHATALMRELERIIRGAYELGALGATDDGVQLYTALGWRRWPGRTAMMTPEGVRRTNDEDGSLFVLEVGCALDPADELIGDWRPGLPW
jgi:aminoglycoside 2'-N-acetyltransferase I